MVLWLYKSCYTCSKTDLFYTVPAFNKQQKVMQLLLIQFARTLDVKSPALIQKTKQTK